MKYWKWLNTNNIQHPKLGKIDLRHISTDVAKQLLLEQSPYLGITPEGQKLPLFKAEEIAPLVANASTLEEAVGFARLSNTLAVRKALEKKAKEFPNG
jgi:hypothetical protein